MCLVGGARDRKHDPESRSCWPWTRVRATCLGCDRPGDLMSSLANRGTEL